MTASAALISASAFWLCVPTAHARPPFVSNELNKLASFQLYEFKYYTVDQPLICA
jgi:hypothetical protein